MQDLSISFNEASESSAYGEGNLEGGSWNVGEVLSKRLRRGDRAVECSSIRAFEHSSDRASEGIIVHYALCI